MRAFLRFVWLPGFDLWFFNTQKRIYLPYWYSPLLPLYCILSPLPPFPFHRGGITETRIHGECQAGVQPEEGHGGATAALIQLQLTMGLLIGKCTKTPTPWMPLSVWWRTSIESQGWPQRAPLSDSFVRLYKVFGKLSVHATTTGYRDGMHPFWRTP